MSAEPANLPIKALETFLFGIRLNDLSAEEVLLAGEFINASGIPVKYQKIDENRRAEIARYFMKMAYDRDMAGMPKAG